jgi:predicted kinase
MADVDKVIALMVANKEPKEKIIEFINNYKKQKAASKAETKTETEVKEDDFVSSIPGLKEKLVKTQETKTKEGTPEPIIKLDFLGNRVYEFPTTKKTVSTTVEDPLTVKDQVYTPNKLTDEQRKKLLTQVKEGVQPVQPTKFEEDVKQTQLVASGALDGYHNPLNTGWMSDNNFEFFTRSEKDARPLLEAAFPNLNFEETLPGSDVIKVTNPKTKKTIEFNVGVNPLSNNNDAKDDKGNYILTPEEAIKFDSEGGIRNFDKNRDGFLDANEQAKKQKALDEEIKHRTNEANGIYSRNYNTQNQSKLLAYNKIKQFINDNSSENDVLKMSIRKSEAEEIRLKVNKLVDDGTREEVDNIEAEWDSATLFKPIETTYYHAPLGRDMKTTTQPYAEELKQAKNELIKYNAYNSLPAPTTGQIQDKAKQIIINKIKEKKLTELLKTREYRRENYVDDFVGEIDVTKKEMYDLAVMNFNSETLKKLDIYSVKKTNLESGEVITKLKAISKVLNGDDKSDLSEGNILELENGVKVPESVYNEYVTLAKEYKNQSDAFNQFAGDLQEDIAQYDDNLLASEIAKKSFNIASNGGYAVLMGLADIYINVATAGPKLMGVPVYQQQLAADEKRYKEMMAHKAGTFAPRVDFDQAFDDPYKFGEWMGFFAADQIPVVATLMTPLGAATLGTSTFSKKYSEMYNENDSNKSLIKKIEENPNFSEVEKQQYTSDIKIKSKSNIYLTSAGYGLSDFLFSQLPSTIILKRFKAGMVNSTQKTTMFNSGFLNYTKAHIPKAATMTVVESVGEGVTQVSQNLLDGKLWHKDVNEAMFGGLMFGTVFEGAPLLKGVYYSKFNNHEDRKEIRKKLDFSKQLEDKNQNLRVKIFTLSEDAKRSGDAKGNDDAINKAKSDIENNNKIIEDLNLEIFEEMRRTDKNLKGLSNDALGQFIRLEADLEKIKIEAQSIIDNDSLTKEQKEDRLKALKILFDNAQSSQSQFLDKKAFGDEYTAFKGNRKNKDKVEEIEAEARGNLIAKGKKDPTAEDIFYQAKIIYNTRKINAEYKANSKAGFNKGLINAQTVEEAINEINKIARKKDKDGNPLVDDATRDLAIEGMKKGDHGVTITDVNGKIYELQVVESMAADDRLETRTHEGGHRVFIQAISADPEAFNDLAETVLDYLKENNPSAYKRVMFRLGNQTKADEVIMLFLEEVAEGKVDVKKSGISGLLATLMNVGVKNAGGKAIDLKGETDAINFLIGIAKKIKDGTISTEDIEDIRNNPISEKAREDNEERKRKEKELKADTQKDETAPGERKVNHTATDSKGNTYTYFADTTEKGGVTTTKFTFNRSDKASTQRNAGGVPTQVALGDNYTIDPKDQYEGFDITQVLEIRESETGASATVRYQNAKGESFNGEVVLVPTTGKKADSKFSSALESINNLIPSDVKTKEDYQEFVRDRKRFAPLGKALEENGVISNYVKSKSVGDEYIDAMESVTDRVIGLRGTFNPERLREDGTKVGKEAFGEFIFANTNFAKRDAKKALAIRKIESDKTTSIDTKEAREIEDQSTIDESTSGRSDGDTKKTNVLNFTGVSGKINELMDVVDIMPVGSNTFKTVDEYTGKAAEIIFDIPAEKATKGNKNLSHKTKVVNGMMELSQAGKIQDFFRVGDNLEKLVKIMVPENVTSKTADISEVGENIDVARDIYGRSIGLKGKVLEYFFDKTEKRSQGLTTQPNVWELKPEFKKPSKETLEQLRADLGITPQGKANVSDRAFNGQLLKGIAEYQAYQTALSITQRKLDAIKQEAATKEEKSAISQDIANVTAAQSKAAFSAAIKLRDADSFKATYQVTLEQLGDMIGYKLAALTTVGRINSKGEEDSYQTRNLGAQLVIYGKETGETIKQGGIRVVSDFLNINPEFRGLLRTTLTGGETKSGGFFLTTEVFDELFPATDVEQIAGRERYTTSEYTPGGFNQKYLETYDSLDENKKLDALYDFFKAVEKHLKGKPNNAWFFLELIRDTSKHQNTLTRVLAPFGFWPVYKDGNVVIDEKVTEEHTDPQNLIGKSGLAGAIFGEVDFVFKVIRQSYMQGPLLNSKKFPHDKIVNEAGFMQSMPNIYYEKIVPRILSEELNLPSGYASIVRLAYAVHPKTGQRIDLNMYMLGEAGMTITQYFGVDGISDIAVQNKLIVDFLAGDTTRGEIDAMKKVPFSKNIETGKKTSAAVSFSRTVNPAKGISVLDFDDTLATTKSGVRYTLPNPDGTPQPKKKVIFMAGGPGSGKSNVINQLGLKEQGFKVVNQDISLEWLMKNHGMPTDMREFTPEQASEFGKLSVQAREIALKKRIKYQGEGDGVVIDGTGASLNVMKKNIQDFKDKGYDVQMIFVETSQETALSRNKARKERSLRTGIVIKTHDSVQANKEAYKELFGERFAEVNTDNLKQGDVMPADVVNKVNDFTSGYIKGRLNAGEYATKGEELKQQGAEFDFSEFNQVVEGKTAPLFNKAMKLQEKFTSKDMFVLTARPAESNQAIFEFLQANGLNIPIENIVGLGSSLSSDKALWMAGKVGEGYNDFYFADDILENVQAVSDMLDQFDVKSKVQQAKRDFVLGDPKVTKLLNEKSMSDVKDVDGLANPGVYSNIKFSKSHRAEYENTVAKNRPDLSGKEVTAIIDKMFDYIDGLDVPNKRKYEQITTKWLATSNIKLPEDSYKIQQAVEIAELKKEDIFSYKNPNEIIEKYAGTIKVKPISPVGIKEFTRATGINDPITTEYGIVEYEVEETREAQQKVRDIVNTHWGPNSNPWCITKIDKDGNLSEDAWRDWTSYGKGPKRIVFQNGKLLAMKANYEYWGKMNKHSEGPIIQVKEGNVTNTTELVVGDGGIVNPIIRETRTVSKDGNTVTTNIFEDSQDGFADGTTIVENRIKGVKTKETRFDPDGSKVSTQEFNKKGKPTTSYQFNPNGKVKSINGHLQQQAITEAGLDVNAREDADIDLTNELVVRVGDIIENNYTETETDYFYGRALIGGQVMEIGFESKTSLDLADVTKTVNGKTRLDIGKVIREVDPDVKGLPKTGVKFSKGISKEFNDIIEQSTGVGSEKVFSDAQAKIRGNKRRFDNIVPYSVQDLMGLLYNFVGRGKAGEQHMEFFKKALIDPFARAINELNQSKQSSAGDYSNLTKAFPNVKKKLNKEVESGDYTYDQAIRVYLWNKAGFEVPGLSKRDLNTLDSIVKNDPELQAFADTLGLISKKEEGYAKPGEHWLVENIASDLLSDGSIGDARSEFLAEWQQNADEMFSKENLNKIQAIYGNKFREALEDILYRMKYGTNRPTGSSRLTNNFMNWINNSTGAIMFFNMRSALLQTLSTTNYINWTDNNPLKAAMAFADQKQYWSDFSALFNSDFLKQRRSGNQRSINEAELTTAVANSDNKAKAAIAWLLQKGFLPTQIMDSFAISSGGATFYRNRINKYIKEGMSPEQAQEKAFLDFQEITEATQQSARPDMISQQQASPLGRLILSFQNTPMQYARIMNKAARDIVNGRGDQKSNISKIVYYGALQSIIFAALQSAIFAALGDDEEEEFDKKKQRIVGSMVDGWLAGLGVAGKAIGTIERSIKEYLKQKERGFNADHAQTIIQLLGFSPPIGSKLRKIYSAIQTEEFNKGVSEKRGFTLDNPTWSSWGNVIEGFTNIPLGRISNKLLNIDNALDSQNQWWERAALLLGWNTWDLGIKDPDIIAVKGEIKEERKVEKKEEALIKKEEKKKEVEEENISKEKANIELQKKEIEDGNKSPDCAAINKRGERCGTKIEKGSTYCTVHTKVEQNDSGKKTQCRKTKKDGKRCKMQTSNKSGYCYYHD